MAHFAEIKWDSPKRKNGKVVRVIVAEQGFINSGVVGDSFNWIQTSYNTRGGVHYDPQTGLPDDGFPLRYNYAGVGYTYDADLDAFIPPQPFASWTMNEDTCLWEPPTPYPTDGKIYQWDEETQQWIETEI